MTKPNLDVPALVKFLKIQACEMRSKELYFRMEADRLEAYIKSLLPLVKSKRKFRR